VLNITRAKSETAEKTLMRAGLMEHLSWPPPALPEPLYADDRSTVARSAGAIFCEIFSRHHFPVRCVTFYTRACGRIYITYSTKQLFPRERDYFCVDLIFDRLHQ